MALQNKKYSSVHTKTGSALAKMENSFNNNEHSGLINFPGEAALIFQIQKMQEELDYLRGLIENNTNKTGMTLGTSSNTALAGDTKIISIGNNTTISFGDMISKAVKGGGTTYKIIMTVTKDGVSKTITHTLA